MNCLSTKCVKRCANLILISICCSCTITEPVKLLKEFEIPFTTDKILTYYYSRLPENDTVVVRFTPSQENGTHYVTEYTYTSTEKISLRKFRTDGNYKELVEDSFFYSNGAAEEPVALNGKIIEHKSVKGNEYDGGKYRLRFQTPDDIVSKITIIESFEKDTAYSWNGTIHPAIKFKLATSFNTFYRYVPFFKNSEAEFAGYVLFVKGVGIVNYNLNNDLSTHSQILIRLEESEINSSYTAR